MNTYSNKSKIEDLTLEVVQEAVASLVQPAKVIKEIWLTPKDFIYIKENTESTELTLYWSIPVIVKYDIEKSKIIYEKS